MLVIAGLRRVHRRQRQRVFHELVGHLGELGVGLMGMAHAIAGAIGGLCGAEMEMKREKQKNAQKVFHSASEEEECERAV